MIGKQTSPSFSEEKEAKRLYPLAAALPFKHGV
jgi:hypothetical protein